MPSMKGTVTPTRASTSDASGGTVRATAAYTPSGAGSGLRAVTYAETTYFSAPEPGIQSLMNSADSVFSSMATSVKPTLRMAAASSSGSGAPATQQARASAVLSASGIGPAPRACTMSETAMRPPGRSTRNASAMTCCLSGERLMTQLEITTSTDPSPTGMCSISPSRNVTFCACSLPAFSRARETMSGVMSTPMTAPDGPTARPARSESKPAPEPRSTTTSPG
mmetsp:Transcript_8931/g.23139  ORF Transcript_8931/g.23139 Transcript_8931/m.23139 type:complete len:224 (+) Transcript_8931:684-1355(+)